MSDSTAALSHLRGKFFNANEDLDILQHAYAGNQF